jgi:uncharacterized membrane protein (DUF485 family)
MKAAFWRFAHGLYQGRKPKLITEVAAFVWFAFFAFIYAGAFIAGWMPTSIVEAIVGTALIGVPLAVGILHRRIRIEAVKAPDALYRKRIENSR